MLRLMLHKPGYVLLTIGHFGGIFFTFGSFLDGDLTMWCPRQHTNIFKKHFTCISLFDSISLPNRLFTANDYMIQRHFTDKQIIYCDVQSKLYFNLVALFALNVEKESWLSSHCLFSFFFLKITSCKGLSVLKNSGSFSYSFF